MRRGLKKDVRTGAEEAVVAAAEVETEEAAAVAADATAGNPFSLSNK